MTTLDEHWNDAERGDWLDEGWHTVRITDYNIFRYNSGRDGVSFDAIDDDNRQCKISGFVLLDQCLWKLTKFAKACGITRDEAARYDPYNERCHRVLVGRKVQVYLERDGKYCNAEDYAPVGEKVKNPDPGRFVRPENEHETSPPPAGNDIPF